MLGGAIRCPDHFDGGNDEFAEKLAKLKKATGGKHKKQWMKLLQFDLGKHQKDLALVMKEVESYGDVDNGDNGEDAKMKKKKPEEAVSDDYLSWEDCDDDDDLDENRNHIGKSSSDPYDLSKCGKDCVFRNGTCWLGKEQRRRKEAQAATSVKEFANAGQFHLCVPAHLQEAVRLLVGWLVGPAFIPNYAASDVLLRFYSKFIRCH